MYLINIAYTIQSLSRNAGGLHAGVSSLAESVAKHGIDLQVIGFHDKLTEADLHAWDAIKLTDIRAKRFGSLHWGDEVSRTLDRINPHLIHTHGLWTRFSAENHKWAQKNKVPYAITAHGMLSHYALNISKRKKYIAKHWFENAHLRDATCLHALSAAEADQFRQYGLTNPICVIPNGIRLPEGKTNEPAPWRGDPRFADRRALLYMGRLHPLKGLPLLLKGWAKLRKECSAHAENWFLAIAGWDEVGHRQELEALVDELHIHDDVLFVGSVLGERKAASLSEASAFILPSYSEAMPMSVLEALSYRLPVLMTQVCNLPEAFEANAALRFDHSEESIFEKVLELIEMDQKDRDAMGVRGYELVQKQFTWSRVAEQMVEVYRWMLGRGAEPNTVRLL